MKKKNDKGAKVKKPIYKRVWFWFITVIVIIGIANSNKTDVNKTSTMKETTSTSKSTTTSTKAPTKNPDVTKAPEIEYDALRTIFINVSYDTTEDDIKRYIEQYGLEYTAQTYNGTPKEIVYKLAYQKNVALQKYADSGDHLQIKFSREDGSLMYANYSCQSPLMNAMLFNYGYYFSLHQSTPRGENSGYYYFKPGQSYNRCNSAKEAIELMFTYSGDKK